jgi:hypothetical protein
MYLQVTEAVAERLPSGVFVDRTFLDRLDVNFANLYLDAYLRYEAGAVDEVCGSWRVLFDRRDDDQVRPLQFALAGMNAHINHDLPIAVTTTLTELGLTLTSHGVREDFVTVNAILNDASDAVRQRLQGPMISALDDVFGPVDNVLAMWGIAQSREAAWRQAVRLYEFLDEPDRYRRLERTLDRLVSLASRCLLTPVADAVVSSTLLASSMATLDTLAERVGDVLWGDGEVDGEDDGLIGTLLWSVRSVVEGLEDLITGDDPSDKELSAVVANLRGVAAAV